MGVVTNLKYEERGTRMGKACDAAIGKGKQESCYQNLRIQRMNQCKNLADKSIVRLYGVNP